MSARITDQPTLDGIKELIERMKAQKAVLHLKQEQDRPFSGPAMTLGSPLVSPGVAAVA
jgi:hypothetical protein